MNRFSIQKQLNTLQNKEREEVILRLTCLQQKCEREGFSLLDTSQLAWKYATNAETQFDSVEDMIEEMKGVDRLYKETKYDTNLQEGMRLIANQFKYEFQFMTWSQVWDVVREYVPLAVKAKTMDTEGFRF